jgi:hypothetical protein
MRASLKKTWALASATAPLTVLFFAALAKTCDFHENRSGAQGLANPAYRLQVYANEGHPQLAATKDWTLEKKHVRDQSPFIEGERVAGPATPDFSTQLARFRTE